jgi:hypothetical protein
MSIKSMKNIFQGSTLLLIVLSLIMLVAKTDIGDKVVLKSNGLAALSTADQSDLPWASQTHHQGVPFGGQVIQTLPCDCEAPGTYISNINDLVSKSGIWLKVDSSSKMYEYWHLIPTRYGIGTYDPVATCAMTINQCNPLPVTGKINRGPGAGTSL